MRGQSDEKGWGKSPQGSMIKGSWNMHGSCEGQNESPGRREGTEGEWGVMRPEWDEGARPAGSCMGHGIQLDISPGSDRSHRRGRCVPGGLHPRSLGQLDLGSNPDALSY